jgi:SAM-dependent methyltransferase
VDPTEQNRKAWDEIHRRRAEEMSEQPGIPQGIRELLPEVDGKHVLHLQCGTGESTAELAELGALVTAVDISTEAIEVARERAPDVAYVHAAVEDVPIELRRGRFNLVFTGSDVIARLDDLDAWVHGIVGALKPGGMLLLFDSYPVTTSVDPLGHWREDYFDGRLRLGEVLDAVIGGGLRVTRLVEFQSLYDWLQRDRRVPWEFALIAEKPE